MFYIFNDGKKDKKKNSGPYKKAIKELIKDIQVTDIVPLLRINNASLDGGVQDIESFILWVKDQGEDIDYNEAEKKLKEFYNKYTLEEMIYFYITILNNALYEDFMIQSSKTNGIELKDMFADCNETQIKLKTKSLIGIICAYSIIFNEKLLEKKIEFIDVAKDQANTKLSKYIKPQAMSLLKGVNGVPLILSSKEADLVSKLSVKLVNDGYGEEMLNHLKLVYSYRRLEEMVSMYCFGSKFNNYINKKEFIGEEAYRIENNKMFVLPIQLIHTRRLVPPVDGVVLKVKDHESIETIYINECTRFNFRMIYGIVRHKDGFEQPVSIRVNYNPIVMLNCWNSPDVASILMDFYNVPNEQLDGLNSLPEALDYEIMSSKYWELREHNYETPGEKEVRLSGKKVKREYPVKIGTYVKRISGNASEQTLKLSEQVRIQLPEKHTLVKEKNRTYDRNEI